MHRFCCCLGGGCSCSDDAAGSGGGEIPSEFGGYGSGVVLYFRFLSCMSCLFFILTTLSLPAALIYSASADWDEVKGESAIDGLWRFTPANLASAASACDESWEALTELEASCPAGTKIARVEAYYGDMQGSCECPSEQVPTGLSCPGVIPRRSDTCADDEFCFMEQARRAVLPSGSTVTTSPCCASQLNEFKQPDFSALDVQANPAMDPACDLTLVTQYIANRVCIGQAGCSVSTDPGKLQPFVDLMYRTMVEEEGMSSEEALQDSDYCTVQERELGQRWVRANRFHQLEVQDAGICATSIEVVMEQIDVTAEDCDLSSHRLVLATWCAVEDLNIVGLGDVSRTNAALTLSLFDFIICLVMLYATYALVSNEWAFQQYYTQATPADYTVLIEHLPPHDSADDLQKRLKSHFEQYLAMCPPVYKHLADGKVNVADINFGLDDQTLTSVKVEQGKAAQKLQKLVAEMTAVGLDWRDLRGLPAAQEIRKDVEYKYCPLTCCGGYWASWCRSQSEMLACRVELLRNEMIHRHRTIMALEQEAKHDSFATRAYVTFEEEEGALRALREFPDAYSYALCCSGREAWIVTSAEGQRKETPIMCRRAEEPSDTIWEHQQSRSSIASMIITIVVFMLFCAAVIGGGGAVLGIEVAKQNALAEFPNIDCDTLPDSYDKVLALKDEYYDVFGQRTGRTGRMGCYCFELLVNSTGRLNLVREEPFPVPGTIRAASEHQNSVLNFSTAQTTGGSNGNGAAVSSFPLPSGWTYEYTCSDWLSSYATATGLTYGGSILIVTINAGMIFFVQFMVSLMELPTKTQVIQYKTVFLFVAQFINTGVTTVLVNARIDSGSLRQIVIGQYDDFSSDWYRDVGSSIMITMILNIMAAQVPYVRDIILVGLMRCNDRDCTCDRSISRSPSQSDYENLQMGPTMRLDELYAICMNTVFVCFVFAGGLPLLMPIALVFMGFAYIMQLYMFTRVNRTPPQYDNRIALSMSQRIPYAVVLHLFVSAWMFSEYDTFPEMQPTDAVSNIVASSSESSTGAEAQSVLDQISIQGTQVSNRLWRTHVLPLVLSGFLLATLLLLRVTLFTIVRECLNSVSRCCTGRHCAEEYEPEGLHNFFDALPLSTLLQYVGPNPVQQPRSHMRTKLIAALQRRTKQVEQKSITLPQAMQSFQHKKSVVESLKLEHARRMQAQAGIRWQIERAMLMEHQTGESDAAMLQHLHQDIQHVGEDLASVQAEIESATAELMQARDLVTAKRAENKRRSTVHFVSTQEDGEQIEGLFVEDDESDSKTLQETHELTYCLDESVPYMRKFGYDVSATIKDPQLLQDFRAVLPQRTSGISSRRMDVDGTEPVHTQNHQNGDPVSFARLQQTTEANVGMAGPAGFLPQQAAGSSQFVSAESQVAIGFE